MRDSFDSQSTNISRNSSYHSTQTLNESSSDVSYEDAISVSQTTKSISKLLITSAETPADVNVFTDEPPTEATRNQITALPGSFVQTGGSHNIFHGEVDHSQYKTIYGDNTQISGDRYTGK